MGSGFAKMKKQARLLEEQMEKIKEERKNQTVEGVSGNGLVTVTLTGEKQLTAIKIKPECVDPQDIEGLEDLILAAYTDAWKKTSEDTPSLGLPAGFSLPF